MESEASDECPFCFEQMQIEERDGTFWMVCPNGCPTEYEIAAEPRGGEGAEPPETGGR